MGSQEETSFCPGGSQLPTLAIPIPEKKELTILPKPPQALRYSYFHVGQALGTPQQILEQGRPQPGIMPPPQPPAQPQQMIQQQQPLLLQPVPPCQPPPLNQHCTPARPLQQIQPTSTVAPATVYQRHVDLVREQQPKHILKQEAPAGMPQRHLPYIVDKSLQSKVREHAALDSSNKSKKKLLTTHAFGVLLCLTQQLRQESENSNVLNYQMKPKGSWRRWGLSTGHFKGEELDDYEETDLTAMGIMGKSKSSSEKSRQGDDARSRWGCRLLL